jgi:hypothetical protein
MRKAEKAGVRVGRSTSFGPFWRVLEEHLAERFQVKPVHTQAEIELLASRFPAEIALYCACLGDEVLGGVVIYESAQVAHVKYISSTQRGRELGALDLLFERLISEQYAGKVWFDFGIATQDEGRTLNGGLAEQKEGFGGRAVVHDFYEVVL